MKAGLNTDALKFAGGAIIIAAAAYIVMPDLVKYVLGLWRLAVLIVVILVVARLIAMMKVKVAAASASSARDKEGVAQPETDNGAEAAKSGDG